MQEIECVHYYYTIKPENYDMLHTVTVCTQTFVHITIYYNGYKKCFAAAKLSSPFVFS